MIDPNWTVVDLDPRTWRNLGRFFDPGQYLRTARPDEHALFVLHDGGRPVNVFDSQQGARPDLVTGPIGDPRLLAHDLFESGDWDRVHVIDKQHLAEVARSAQRLENRALTLDAYYRRVYELLWQTPAGYVSLPPHPGDWNHWTYTGLRAFVERLPDPATVVLGVLEGGEVAIGLIVEVGGGLIRRLTTFEALTLAGPLELSAAGLAQLCAAVEAGFPRPAAALLCDRAAFETWIAAADKWDALQSAGRGGSAFWRIQLKS